MNTNNLEGVPSKIPILVKLSLKGKTFKEG